MLESLSSFDYLGIRDNTTIQELLKINPALEPEKNPDPTFLFEFVDTPNLKDKLENIYNIDLNKPIIALTLRDEAIGKAIMDRFGSEYQVVSIFRANKFVEKYILDLDYFEWANVFSYFSGVVTDLFHGTIFSIKNSVPFVSVDKFDSYLEFPGKIEDLLEGINLKDNYFNMNYENFSVNSMLDKLAYNMENKNQFSELCYEARESKKSEAQNCVSDMINIINNQKELQNQENMVI
ncbi:MAG: polysaccharide pyruvyl transferase family protein [Bacillus subtilis]|nr:polysaccharide pyruvyl transferase family protein [Bacillus subtilis]